MRTREDGEAISERILAPPGPGDAQPAPPRETIKLGAALRFLEKTGDAPIAMPMDKHADLHDR